jgi:hypothetical protein
VRFQKIEEVEFVRVLDNGDILAVNAMGNYVEIQQYIWERDYKPKAEALPQSDIYIMTYKTRPSKEEIKLFNEIWLREDKKGILLMLSEDMKINPSSKEKLKKLIESID